MFTKFTHPHPEKLPKWQILLELPIHEGLDHKLLIQLNQNRLIGLKYLMSKGEETKAKILHQAAELFNQQGYAGSSISDIMRVTGLQKGGIYNHFSSKDELALQAFDYAIAQIQKLYRDAWRSKHHAIERLQAIMGVFHRYINHSPIKGGCPLLNTAIESDDAHPALREHAEAAMKTTIESPTKPFRLITIPVSHYCEKARWALNKLKFTYREEAHTPPFHLLATGRVGGKTTPVLVTEAGVFIDSTDILRYLDSIVPSDAKLYPTDPNQRQEVEKLEDLFNSQLGPATRCWGYFHIMNSYKIMQSRWCQGVPFFERSLFPIVFPVTRSFAKRKLNINPESAAQAYEKIQSIFEQVNKLLADGRTYLVADKFSAADLTFAALAAPAVQPSEHPMRSVSYKELPPKFVSEINAFRKTPASDFVLRLYRDRNS